MHLPNTNHEFVNVTDVSVTTVSVHCQSVLQQLSPMSYEKLLHETHTEHDGQLGSQPPLDASIDSGADGTSTSLMVLLPV